MMVCWAVVFAIIPVVKVKHDEKKVIDVFCQYSIIKNPRIPFKEYGEYLREPQIVFQTTL